MLTNSGIVKMLYEMAAYYEMEDAPFKPRAYERAAHSIESLETGLRDIYAAGGTKALMKIPGIGPGIAGHIEELLIKGRFKEYERLKKKIPVDVSALVDIEGVGPRMIYTLWKKLKVRTLEDLERAAKDGRIRKLANFGEKSETKILKGIGFHRSASGRRTLGFMLPEIRKLTDSIREFPEVSEVVAAGSVRRMKETIGDIDIIAVSSRPERVMERFVALPFIAAVYGRGTKKTLVRLRNGLDADLRVVSRESFGAALNYFTGSKDHNIALRKLAVRKKLKLNEYGLFKGKKMLAGETEEGLYKALGLRYIEPELRENRGEIEAARKNALPRLIGYGDLKGDLQVQTDWTDGAQSMEDMALAAEKAGLEYIAITDHTKTLAMTGGSDEKKLLRQMAEIDKLNKKLKASGHRITVLKGAEVNILKDGTLDIDGSVLARLDVVGAAVHSHFRMPREEQTARLLRAIEDPNIDIIFHLTGRRINRRDPIELDVDAVIAAAKRTGTMLEIDAFPDRLDLRDEYIRKCVEAGVTMTIDSDAHHSQHFSMLELGIAQARRGWAEKDDIANTKPLREFLKLL